MSKRLNKVNLVIGRRGSGKTWRSLKMVEVYAKKYNKVFIFDTINHEDYKDKGYPIISPGMIPGIKRGIVRVMVNLNNFQSVMSVIREHCRNCALLYEDAGKYITETIDNDFRNVILDTKQRNVDADILFHGFGDVPPKLYRDADTLTIFKTNDSPAAYRSKIPQFETVRRIHDQVMSSPVKWESKTILIN